MSGLFGTLAVSTMLAATLNSGVTAPTPPPLESESNTSVAANSDSTSMDDLLDSANSKSDETTGGSSVDVKDESGSSSSSSKDSPTGIDISSHQHSNGTSIDIPQVVKGGQEFAFIKATEGNHYINPSFRKDVISFMKKKTPIGFYHYARPNEGSAKEQAKYFVTVTGISKGVKSFPPVLDIEEDGGLSSDELIKWVEDFTSEVKKMTGRDVMIYTYTNFWQDKMDDTEKFSDLPLWIANYAPSLKKSAIPGGWNNWTFWQYTSKGTIDGYNGEIDVNVFNGDSDKLKKLYTASDPKDSKKTSSDSEPVTVTETVDPPKVTVTSTVTSGVNIPAPPPVTTPGMVSIDEMFK